MTMSDTGSAEGSRQAQQEPAPPQVPGGTTDPGLQPATLSNGRIIVRALATIGFIFGMLMLLSITPGMNHSPAVAHMLVGLLMVGTGAFFAFVAAVLDGVAIFGRRERSGVTIFFFLAELAYVLFALGWARSSGML